MRNNNSLKTKTAKGIFWSATERLSVQGAQFLVSIVLARLLLPSDFGLIGMLSIFIALSQTLVNSGMGTGLIQKKDRTEVDYSTVFVFNFAVSCCIYFVLFFTAPLIADFYRMPQLRLLTRVLCLNIIVNALAVVQIARLTINLDFKTIAKANIFSVIFSSILGIFLAIVGFGVWALVFQNLSRAFVSVVLFWFLTGWKPSFNFSRESFRSLFGFGSKLLGAGIISTMFTNIYNVVIGRTYSSAVLGYYTQGYQFSNITAGTVVSVLHNVTFPVLTSLQDDEVRMVAIYKKMIGMTAFFILPIMTLLAILASPFIRFFLSDKWLPMVPLLQWLCFARIVTPISALNMNILNAKGRSDLFLKVDLSKLPIIVIALIITIPLGIKAVVIGNFVTSIISFFINAYMPGRLFQYGALSQLKDMLFKILSTILMTVIVFLSIVCITSPFFKLLIGLLTGLFSYYILSSLFKVREVNELRLLLKSYVNRGTEM